MNEIKQKLRDRCDDILRAIGISNVEIWWNSPNKAFELSTPEEIWATDKYGLVYSYLLDSLEGY